MSRTYHHGNKKQFKKFGSKHYGGHYPDAPTPPKKKKEHCHWLWLRKSPSWWIKEFMTVPQRAETRICLRAALYATDLESIPEFPLPKKPYVYFW